MIFSFPYAFLLFIVYLEGALLQIFLKGGRFNFSSIKLIDRSNRSLRVKTMFIPPLLLNIGLLLLIFCSAGPEKIEGIEKDEQKGYAIQIAIDRSSSMLAETDGTTRFEAAKIAAESFVMGNSETGLKGRPDDLTGLVVYARYPETVFPLSLNHALFQKALSYVIPADQNSGEDGTNIGDSLAVAAARLVALNEQSDYNIEGKFVILLTDGMHRDGEKSPAEAAEYAAKHGVKVYTVNFNNIQANFFNREAIANAEKTLQQIASVTGGKYFKAEDSEALFKVYKEIDSIEKSKFEQDFKYKTEPLYLYFLIPALIIILLSFALSSTVYRRLP
jgi:Ca-activated chloride channel family protein